MEGQDVKALVKRWFEAAWNEDDAAVLEETTAPDFELHAAGPGPSPGLEGLKMLTGMWRSAFPEGRMEMEDMIAEDDKVVVRWTAAGEHRGPLFGSPPTGASVRWTGITIYRVADGRVCEGWGEQDSAGLMQQLVTATQPSSAS
ncbi:MAG: ester cyclase [Chloroflexia bacterium]